MKLCVDCRHYVRIPGSIRPAECRHPSNLSKDPVTGYVGTVSTPACLRMRGVGRCGPGGINFAPRPPKRPGPLGRFVAYLKREPS